MAPSLLHETAIPVRPEAGCNGIIRFTPEKFSSTFISGLKTKIFYKTLSVYKNSVFFVGPLVSWYFLFKCERYVKITEYFSFVPIWTHPRRVSYLEVEAASLEHCGEIEVPVEEALLFGDSLGHPQPGMCIENRLDPGRCTSESPLVGLVLVEFCPVVHIRHRRLVRFAGKLLSSRFVGRFAKQLLAGVDPFLDIRGCDLSFGKWPEPQCTPSIHHPAQTLIRPIRVCELGFDFCPSHCRPWSRLLETPHADGPPGLGLSDGQTLERDLPEHVGLFREPDEPGDLPVGLRIAELRS